MTTFDAALAIYQEYEELMRAAGSPLPDHLAPAHPDPAGAFAASFPGLTLPDELIAWWAWHDGPAASAPSVARVSLWARIPASMETTLAATAMQRRGAEIAAEPPEMPADDFWSATWLSVLEEQGFQLAVELADEGSRGAVRFVEWGVMGRNAPTVAAALPQVVEWWSALLRVGATVWDPEAPGPGSPGAWVTDEASVPDDLRGNLVAYWPADGHRAAQFNPLADY